MIKFVIIKDEKRRAITSDDLRKSWKLIALHLYKPFQEFIRILDSEGLVIDYLKPKRGSGHKRIGGERDPHTRGGKFINQRVIGKGENEMRSANTSTAYFFNEPYKGIPGNKRRFTVGSIYYLLKKMGCSIHESKTSFIRHFKERYINNNNLTKRYSAWLDPQ